MTYNIFCSKQTRVLLQATPASNGEVRCLFQGTPGINTLLAGCRVNKAQIFLEGIFVVVTPY